ncbi:Sfi1-domain-containing protein, partial [Coniochaeta ligniaria NRRL 30616]
SATDIRLLHEVVTTGEEILPTLPERDRLATNALFLAAEQVLPAHGYDPDHAPSNISRLIFKIGGLRSEGSLMDKFSSVLEGMGINLEIVESPEQQEQEHHVSPSVKSSASAAVDQTGTFSISPRYDARRRRNSESAAPTAPIEDLRDVPTLFNSRARSDRDVMEDYVQDFRSHYAHRKAATILDKWINEARNTAQRHQHQEAEAIAHDNELALAEVLNVWRATAEAAKMERLASQGPIRDSDEDDWIERRVTRAYNRIIVRKAFWHWFASAQDEVERTEIARRHILRKRYFEAWRSHQADVEAKIHTFRLRTLIRVWKRAAIHQEVRENFAVQRYRHNLVENVFNTWYDEYRAQLADELWACRVREKYMIVWKAETRRSADLYEECFFIDQRFLLERVISIWRRAAEELQMMAYGCTGQKLSRDLQRALQDWWTLASLNKKLREFTEERDRRIKSQIIDQWVTQNREADQQGLLARRLDMQELVVHWRNEAKFRIFKDNRLRELKLEVISHWRLEVKLANYKRLRERRTKEGILAKLRTAAAESKTEAIQVLQTADTVAERREKASILRIWRGRTSACLDQRDTATDRYFFSMASSCVEHWYIRAGEEASRIAELRAFAARGAYYVAASNVIGSWAEITKRARRERLTRAYHTFRRRYKVSMVDKCLSKWRAATRESHGLSYDADNIYGGYLRDELADCVQLWRNATNMMQIIREVASTADQEVWWGKWSRQARDLRETELDAADYCNDQTLSRCWRTWAFAMLQNKGRQHVVATLQENNNKRLCRQILAQWSQKAAPGGTHPDLRSSVASRRSVRYGSVRASLPQRPSGYSKRESLPVAATPQALAPISSFPANAGIPPLSSPPYRRPATVAATTTTPSAVLDTPYERALRHEYAGGTGGGMLASDRRSALGGGRMATTPRVTFADIREESGEGMYDEGDGR